MRYNQDLGGKEEGKKHGLTSYEVNSSARREHKQQNPSQGGLRVSTVLAS